MVFMLARDLQQVAFRLLKALDVPEASVISDHIKHQRWDELVKIKFNPLRYESSSLDYARRVCLAQEFLRKADFLETSVDKSQVARDSFLLSERQCALNNSRLERFLRYPVYNTALERAYGEIIIKARRWVKNTLGPLPEYLDGHFGPGATFESRGWRHRRNMTAYDKLRNMPCASHNVPDQLIYHLISETGMRFAWANACPLGCVDRVRGNRFTTVPKDATKDRGIAIEPGLNVFGQLAIGRAIRSRLLRRNIDLSGDSEEKYLSRNLVYGIKASSCRYGQDLHRRLAKSASLTGDLCTIDLSNASDTICTGLVELLLPEDWHNLLCDLRSPETLFSPSGKEEDSSWYKLHKFSSMGNGYTFELETLIFCSLLHSVGCHIGTDTFVYGDDMIVPTDRMADVLAVLRYSGLTPNNQKTFGSNTQFRESCGGDFLRGQDIRPFYIKELPDAPEDWICIANNLWHWSIKWQMPELMAVRASVLDLLPADIRKCRGPEELGDLVIHDVVEKWSAIVRGSRRFIRVWRPVQKKSRLFRVKVEGSYWLSESDVAVSAALLGLPSDGMSPRNSVSGYRFGRVIYS